MPKRKLAQFAENKTFRHVIEPSTREMLDDTFSLKGNWSKSFFGNDRPLVLELGCGKGEYSVGLGRLYPEKNFVGVDIKGARIWRGAKTVDEENIPNVAFLRTRIDFITSGFGEFEVAEIWLTFSDPMLRQSENRRLTSKQFTDRYRQILKKDGVVNLKTDSDFLFEYTLEQIEKWGFEMIHCTADVYGDMAQFSPEMQQVLGIKTHYEKKWLAEGQKIKYCAFRL
jgi:tRNA (guanine-N7-)-methyltransferase